MRKFAAIGLFVKKYTSLKTLTFFNFSISRFSLSGNLPAGKHECYICGDDVHANDFPSSVHEEIPHDYQVCTIMIIWHKLVINIFVLIQNPFLTHYTNFITLTWISQTQFGYDVNGVDIYGNPNVHSRTEVREGPHVKGEAFINFW